jgi:hypothetical protein
MVINISKRNLHFSTFVECNVKRLQEISSCFLVLWRQKRKKKLNIWVMNVELHMWISHSRNYNPTFCVKYVFCRISLTFSNPIFLPTANSPAFIRFGWERGWWISCNYPTVLKEKTWRNRKSTTCAICWLKPVLHEEKRRTGSVSGRTNATKTVSDVFRHRSRTGKSYCRTRSDVWSERVKLLIM